MRGWLGLAAWWRGIREHATHRTRVGERALALVEAHAKDDWPFTALGAVNGAERDRVGVVLRDAPLLLRGKVLKVVNQGQSRSIKGDQGRSHLLRGEDLKVVEQTAKPLAAALGTGAGSVR